MIILLQRLEARIACAVGRHPPQQLGPRVFQGMRCCSARGGWIWKAATPPPLHRGPGSPMKRPWRMPPAPQMARTAEAPPTTARSMTMPTQPARLPAHRPLLVRRTMGGRRRGGSNTRRRRRHLPGRRGSGRCPRACGRMTMAAARATGRWSWCRIPDSSRRGGARCARSRLRAQWTARPGPSTSTPTSARTGRRPRKRVPGAATSATRSSHT